jgi:hypothetical protein
MYGETLARCTHAVYPPRLFRTTSRWWASVFLWLWLGHMYVYSKGFDMHSPRSSMYRETLARRGLPPLIFQSVIACVPTEWSHLLDSSTTPISIYYGHMIAMEGVATTEARCTVKP